MTKTKKNAQVSRRGSDAQTAARRNEQLLPATTATSVSALSERTPRSPRLIPQNNNTWQFTETIVVNDKILDKIYNYIRNPDYGYVEVGVVGEALSELGVRFNENLVSTMRDNNFVDERGLFAYDAQSFKDELRALLDVLEINTTEHTQPEGLYDPGLGLPKFKEMQD